jgi:hypothetical protein
MLLVALGGCATLPVGPSVMVLPAPGKPIEQFRYEDADCRQWAGQQIGMPPQEVVSQNAASGAVAGTAIGAGIGALIGSASGHAGGGAAIGAAAGLLAGASSGANEGRVYGWEAQRRYDIAYMQCMYSRGNQLPGGTVRPAQRRRYPPPPPPDYVPEPPAVTYPPGSIAPPPAGR